MRRLAVLIFALASACGSSPTGIELTVRGLCVPIDRLVITARYETRPVVRELSSPSFLLPVSFVAQLPDRALAVSFSVEAYEGSRALGQGQVDSSVEAHQVGSATVTLLPVSPEGAACPDAGHGESVDADGGQRDRACVPQCAVCGDPDGRGGTCQTGACGGPNEACAQGRCLCASGFDRCGGICTNLRTDGANCGACRHACPNGRACAAGQCPCMEPADNSDGHCCPQGMVLRKAKGLSHVYCYSGPKMAADLSAAQMSCKALFGLSCAGVGIQDVQLSEWKSVAVPDDASCGYHLVGYQSAAARSGTWVAAVGMTTVNGAGACSAACGLDCTCTTCSCALSAPGCQQPFYCVMDPLGPRATTCVTEGCPPGMTCAAGQCVQASTPACATDNDCVSSKCASRGFPSVTGQCQTPGEP